MSDEDYRRIFARNLNKYMEISNKKQADIINDLGINKRKGLKKSQQILDHMGYEELAANLFRATQTEAKLRRENIQGKANANQTHFEVGKKVRDTIKDLGGTMPEDLPTPDKSIKQIEKEQKKLENKQKR